jgi:tetratricopeptide (TPR) repeat protein
MARRRLNKRVALMGTTVFLLLGLAAVAVILRLNRSPAPYIADGDAAWARKDYETAIQNYKRAYGLTKAPEEKVELAFKLADAYQGARQWERVLSCWETIVTSDPQNVKARLAQLKYDYVLVDGLGAAGRSASDNWDRLLTEARETLKVAEAVGAADDPQSRWETLFGPAADRHWAGGTQPLGQYLRFIKGRAALELASMRAVTSPGELLQEAQTDLEEVRRLDPHNAQVYQYLARAFVTQGEMAASRGNLDQKEAAEKQADAILAEGVQAAGGVPEAHIHLLARKLTTAQRGGILAAREQMKALGPQYEALTRKFTSSPQALAALAQFYSFYATYLDSRTAIDELGKAIQAVEQARALDSNSVEYLILAASYQYRKFSLRRDVPALEKAVELAETALNLPDANDAPGPMRLVRRLNRVSLDALLAKCCVERVLSRPESDPMRERFLARAERAVHEIQQIHGSGEDPEVVKWQGMLDLAYGRTGQAVKNLYAAYEQIKAANPPEDRDPFLSYTLANVFQSTSEAGAVIEFLGAALSAGITQTRPEALLDYGDVLLSVGSYDAALSAVHSFAERFGENPRNRVLRLRALIAAGHLTEAEEGIGRRRPDDPNTVALNLELLRAKVAQLLTAIRQGELVGKAPMALRPAGTDLEARSAGNTQAMTVEVQNLRRRQAELMQRLLQLDPNAVAEREVIDLCAALLPQDVSLAKAVVEAFLPHAPNSAAALFYQGLLAEPDPANCSAARRKAIQEGTMVRMPDLLRRSLELGAYYQQNQQWDQAVSQWRRVLEATAAQGPARTPAYLKVRQLSPRHVAASLLFDLAHERANWSLAQEMVDIAKRDDLDDCAGHLFAARLAYAQGERETALKHLDECLKLRPIFSYGYMLRGNVRAEMGRDRESIADLRRAAELNPMDALVAKALANAFCVRNGKLDNKLSSEQQLETKQALERAIQLDPRDVNLLAVYADFISASEPLKALALRQTIQINAPSVNNAVMLGKLATQVALKETEEARRNAFFTLAETAFEQARKMEPTNQFVLESYAEYYRAREQNEKARQLLVASNDNRLLWRHYFRVGRYDEARTLLEKMYAENKERIDALKGLVLLAQQSADRQGVKKYSEELLSLEDNVVNRLAQLQAYLDVGLVEEAEQRLQSLREKYPNEPRASFMEALLAKRQGQLPRALELVNRHLAGHQEDAAAWRLRGEVSLLMGDHDRAVLDFKKSRTLTDDPVTTLDLAKAYLWMGRNEEAMDELQRLLGRPEAPLEARTMLEAIYLKLGRTEALQQLYREVLVEYPDNVFWLNRAGAFALEQRQYDRAEELYAKAYQLEQKVAEGRPVAQAVRDAQYVTALDGYLRALILAAGGPAGAASTWRPQKLDAVSSEAGKYIETPYAAAAFCRMAEAKKKLGDMEAARDYCRQAVDKAWADDRMAMEVLRRVYAVLGGEEVSQYCRQRLQNAPDSLPANFTMFNLAKIQDRYDEAVTYIDRCIQLAGPDTDAGVEYLIRKAELLTAAHRKTSDKTYLTKAIGVYESLRAKMPKNSSVLNNLAYLLAQNDEKLTEALEYARTAVEQSPGEANYLDTYAYVLYKNGRNAEAAERLAAALQQYEAAGAASAEVYEHLGMVNEALGEKDKAQAAYRRALDLGTATMSRDAQERINAALKRLTP